MSVPESEKECPLCMEALDWDDLGFFPCSCGYQICRFCWHRLRTDENGLCPACRQAFPDIPVSFNPEISAEELKRQKKRNKERRSNKDQVFKPQDLATLRVVQKNLVFVIGLSSRLTQEDLKKEFAHFGKIIKFVHNKSTAYITYSKPEEAIRAIKTLNASAAHESAVQHLQFQSQLTNGTSATCASTNLVAVANTTSATAAANSAVINNSTPVTSLNNTNSSSFINAMSVPVPPNRLKASLGTTKYCNHFLRSQQCPKVGECMYLHEIAEAEASFTKEQMQAGKHVEYEKKLMDSYLAKLEWQANLVSSQNNGYRVSQNNLPAIQQVNPHNQTLAQQISSQLSANQLSPSHQSQQLQQQLQHQQQQQQQQQQQNNFNNFGHRQPNATTTNISAQSNSNNINRSSSEDLSPNHQLPTRPSIVSQTLLQQAAAAAKVATAAVASHQSLLDHSPNHMIRQQGVTNQQIITRQDSSDPNGDQSPGLKLASGQQQQQPPTLHSHSQQQLHNQQLQHQQLQLQQHQQSQQPLLDSDSDDDGLDFDPISVSTSGLRDLLDQQVQQAKQLQMQNYFHQLNTNQSLANVLFQNNRLSNQQQQAAPASHGLLGEAAFNGHHQQLLPTLAGLANAPNHQQQVSWQNLSAWTNFLQRSGYGFENGR